MSSDEIIYSLSLYILSFIIFLNVIIISKNVNIKQIIEKTSSNLKCANPISLYEAPLIKAINLELVQENATTKNNTMRSLIIVFNTLNIPILFVLSKYIKLKTKHNNTITFNVLYPIAEKTTIPKRGSVK